MDRSRLDAVDTIVNRLRVYSVSLKDGGCANAPPPFPGVCAHTPSRHVCVVLCVAECPQSEGRRQVRAAAGALPARR